MTSYFDKLNLRPGERRLVVAVALAVFFVINLWLVWPHFGDLRKLQIKKAQLRTSLARYQAEISKVPAYQKQLAELKTKGTDLATAERALELLRTVQSQAAIAGVQVNSYTPTRAATSSAGKTNQFFEEESGTLSIMTEEKSLVEFLYGLGSGNSLIRVRSMTLQPEPATKMRLAGSVMLAAAYPRKPPVPAGPARAVSPLARETNVPARVASSPFAKPGAASATHAVPATAATKPGFWGKVKSMFSTDKPSAPAPGTKPSTNALGAKKAI